MDIKRTSKDSFDYKPSFGASVSFSSLAESQTLGDNHKKMMSKGINSLNMKMSLNFPELTDDESNELISFLQSKYYYSPQNYNADGSFDNQRIEPFDYQPFFPYKKNKFYCHQFNQQKNYYNCNDVMATLECAYPSILDSVESSAGHNGVIDCLLDAVGYTVAESESPQSIANAVLEMDPYPGAEIVLLQGSPLFVSGEYRSITVSDNLWESYPCCGSQQLNGIAKFGFGGGKFSTHSPKRNSIFIHNPSECFEYPYEPEHENGTSEYRMFDFHPSYSVTLSNSPKYKTSTPTDFYKRFNLYGFNANAMNLRLTFSHRNDIEAKRILLFLESHLGHNKFGFHLPQPYHNSILNSTHHTPHRRTYSHFYCPEWTHNIVYKDNHTIEATFIECIDY